MKKIIIFLCILIGLFGLTGCSKEEVNTGKQCEVYYISNSETKLEMHEYLIQSETMEEQIEELLIVLQTMPSSLKFKAPMAMGFDLLNYKVVSGKIELDVSAEYLELSDTQEVLVRAAIVKTLTQLPRVSFVSITVEGNPLTDSLGNVISWETGDQFIENESDDYQAMTFRLYFANAEGDSLIRTTRTREYSNSISKEKLIVEELIKGPDEEGLYPTINPQTKVAKVTVQDGVCYVDLDETFLSQVYNVSAEVTIYSIVNSLIELQGINKVQISVNGDSRIVYREKLPLENYYEKNQEIIEKK